MRSVDIKMVAFSDDDLIPPECVARLAQDYGLDATAITVIDPANHGLTKIGHIGVFARRRRADWDRLLA